METESRQYPTLDAHAHILRQNISANASELGAVLAMSLSLEEAALAVGRHYAAVSWGAGCHPRFPRAQAAFDPVKFKELIQKTAIVGEIGLDTGSRVPLDAQLKNFRKILEIIADLPRIVSIHSYQATGLVLRELRAIRVEKAVLHGWAGSADETSQAVELGCYFSVHSQVARQSKFRTRVPRERILVESDHGYNDPPAAIPCRIQWVEYLVAQQLRLDVMGIRRLVWTNFSRLVDETGTRSLLPEQLAFYLDEIGSEPARPTAQEALPGIA